MSKKRILALFFREKARWMEEYILKKYGSSVQVTWERASANLSSIDEKPVLLIFTESPLSYLKKLQIFFSFLNRPSEKKILISGPPTSESVIDMPGLLKTLVLAPFTLTLILAGSILSILYFACAFLFLKIPLSFKQDDPYNISALMLYPVLHLIKPGTGAVSHLKGTVSGFKRIGWRVRCAIPCCIDGIDPADSVLIPPILRNILPGGIVDAVYDMRFLFKTISTTGDFSPRFIYQRHGRFALSGLILSRIKRVPLILEVNAVLHEEGTRWGKAGRIRTAITGLCERLCFSGAFRISAVSQALAEKLMEQGVAPEKIFVNPNGVDTDIFHPRSAGEEIRKRLGIENATIIGFSGSFAPWQRLNLIGETVSCIIPEREDTVFILMGEGPEKITVEEDLKRRGIPFTNLSGNHEKAIYTPVIFTGRIPHTDIPKWLSACDILLMTQGEGFEYSSPIKLFEYMALEKAIVAIKYRELENLVINGEEAILTDGNDSRQFAGAILTLCHNPEERKRLGENARRKALKNYTWHENARRIISSYTA